MTGLAFRSAAALAEDIRRRRIGCLELLEHYLARVERFNPRLNAVIVRRDDEARERARAADAALARSEVWGPLHGIPMTIKESYDVAGWPTTWGNPAWRDHVPAHNATAVDRLLGAGAILFGKTNVPLMLGDFQTYNAIHGTTGNPWDPARVPGGSSGGSAAVLAAGLAALEAGSDIGGSLRNPAHYCGVYAHKPTWGIVPSLGQAPPGVRTPADLAVVGPMARSAGDLALALDVMAGPDALAAPGWRLDLPPPRPAALQDYRVAVWADDPIAPVDAAVRGGIEAAAAALERAGCRVDRRARPDLDPRRSHEAYLRLLRGVIFADLPASAFERYRQVAETAPDDDRSYRATIARHATLRHRDWLALNEARTRLRHAWRAFFAEWDVLLAPIALTPAFPHQQEPDWEKRTMTVDGRPVPYLDQIFWAGLFTVAYLPATAVPAGRTADGLPVGFQIVGPELGDRTTLDLACRLADLIGGFIPPPGYA